MILLSISKSGSQRAVETKITIFYFRTTLLREA